MKIILDILIKFLSPETISSVIARLISKLMTYASKRGGDYWDVSKRIISKIRVWIDLFDEVYKDDEMTQEEEELVAQAIRNEVELDKVSEILNDVNNQM